MIYVHNIVSERTLTWATTRPSTNRRNLH